MKTVQEIIEMRDLKRKQSRSKKRPDYIRRIDAACAMTLDWVLVNGEENEIHS